LKYNRLLLSITFYLQTRLQTCARCSRLTGAHSYRVSSRQLGARREHHHLPTVVTLFAIAERPVGISQSSNGQKCTRSLGPRIFCRLFRVAGNGRHQRCFGAGLSTGQDIAEGQSKQGNEDRALQLFLRQA